MGNLVCNFETYNEAHPWTVWFYHYRQYPILFYIGRKQTLFLYRLMSDIYLYRRILKNCNIRNTVNFSGRKHSLRILFWINYKIQFCYYWWIWHNVFIEWDSDIFGVLNAVNLYRAIVNVVPHPSLSLNPKLVRK